LVQSIHATVKGRVRLKVDGLYRSEKLKRHLEEQLAEKNGISAFSANFLTGHILVIFDPGVTLAEITDRIREAVRNFQDNNGHNQTSARKTSLYETFFVDARGPIKGKTSKELISGTPVPGSQKSSRTKTEPPSRRKTRQLVLKSADQAVEHWHILPAEDLLTSMEIQPTSGLSAEAATQFLHKYGPNLLPEAIPRSGWAIFIEQFKSLPVIMLGIGAAISAATGGFADAVVIAAVVLINAVIGYITESQTEKTIHSLKRLVRPTAEVLRAGQVLEIGADAVVPGDLLVLKPGAYVAADARLIALRHLSVDESTLTGESMPVMKTIEHLKGEDIPLADRTNMVYMGTLVTGGQGLALVVATGRFTEIGKIQTMVGEAEAPETPMARQLDQMGRQLVWVSSAICAGVFLIGLLRGYGVLQMLTVSISLAVAAVPEGLPTVSTTTLTLGIRRMRQLNVLIRHLEAVETLGSVRTICLDKTGTLTMNSMSVRALFTGSKRLAVSEGKFSSPTGVLDPYSCRELLTLLHVCVLCNESELVIGEQGKFVVNGSSTENAFIHTALGAGVDVLQVRQAHPTFKVNHRSETSNYMYTLHRSAAPGSTSPNGRENGSGKVLVALKGSPDEVTAMCQWYMEDGEVRALDEDVRLEMDIQNERMAGEALRVLGVAYCLLDEDHPPINGTIDFRDNLIWLGLVGMADPIRPGMTRIIDQFHKAGIDTIMITGDQSATAYAVGKELKLSQTEQIEIIDSTQFAGLSPEILRSLAEKVQVFSRVSPAHKLQIVRALQSAGRVVAMTGDGINDGPALKAADIGIAMGHTGTDVAREVADVVLEDDNLETMIVAISQGRTIYNNTRKAIHYLNSTNFSEIMVMTLGIGLGLGQPLNGMQLLWINLISDIFPGLALALEPAEPDVLAQPPRDPNEPIVKSSDFKRIARDAGIMTAGTLGAYVYGVARYGIGPAAGTIAFTTLCGSQLLHAFTCRSETHSLLDDIKMEPNRKLNIVIGTTLAVQALTFVVPPLRTLLGLTPIGLIDGVVIIGGAALPLLANEAIKKSLISANQTPVPTLSLLPHKAT
jgi:Ca2+-transporting ATPase